MFFFRPSQHFRPLPHYKSGVLLTCLLTCLLVLAGCVKSSQIQALKSLQSAQSVQLTEQSQLLQQQHQMIETLTKDRAANIQDIANLRWDIELLRHQLKAPSNQVSHRVNKESSPVISQASQNPSMPAPPASKSNPQNIKLGAIESVWFNLFGKSLATKLDGQTRLSKVYVSEVHIFERNGKQWVKFLPLALESTDLKPQLFETPLVRRIKLKSMLESSPVVKLKFKLQEWVDETEFVIIQKNHRQPSIALGSHYLRDLVDAPKSL